MLPGLDRVELPADAVEVGRVVDAWGVQGWFRVGPYSKQPEALFSSKRWFLMPPTRGARSFQGPLRLAIRQARLHADMVVAQAADIGDRDTAELLRGARVFIPRSSFPTAGQDEYYWVDLLGLGVVNREGVCLGKVRDLIPTGPHSVLVIDDTSSDPVIERMIPFVSSYVDDVDLPGQRIVVDWQPDY